MRNCLPVSFCRNASTLAENRVEKITIKYEDKRDGTTHTGVYQTSTQQWSNQATRLPGLSYQVVGYLQAEIPYSWAKGIQVEFKHGVESGRGIRMNYELYVLPGRYEGTHRESSTPQAATNCYAYPKVDDIVFGWMVSANVDMKPDRTPTTYGGFPGANTGGATTILQRSSWGKQVLNTHMVIADSTTLQYLITHPGSDPGPTGAQTLVMHYIGNDVIDPGHTSAFGASVDGTDYSGIGTHTVKPPVASGGGGTPVPGAPITPVLSPTTSSSVAPSHPGLPDKPEYNWYYFDKVTGGQFKFNVGKTYFISIKSKLGFKYCEINKSNSNGFGGIGTVDRANRSVKVKPNYQLAFAYSDDTTSTGAFLGSPTFETSTNPGYADPNNAGDWLRRDHKPLTVGAWEEIGQVFTAPADPLNPSATTRDLGLLQLGIGDDSGASKHISSTYNTPTLEFGAYGGAVAPSKAVYNLPAVQNISTGTTGPVDTKDPALQGHPHSQPYVKKQMCFVEMENVNVPGQVLHRWAYWNGEVFMVGDDKSEFTPGTAHPADQEILNGFVYNYYQLIRVYAYDTGVGGSLNIAGRGYVKGVYGMNHLLAVRMIANDYVSNAGATRISARVNRKINSVIPGTYGLNNNPASIIHDIMTDATYGAGLPSTSVERPLLQRLHTKWGGDVSHRGFNASFNGQSNIAEALNTVAQITGSSAITVGPMVSIAPDLKQGIRRQVFTENNIVAGSLSYTYDFEKDHQRDSIVIEYKDPEKGRDRSVKYPANSINPEYSALFGCTDESFALEYAKLIENRRNVQRVMVKFETELEGLLCRVGDRIAVSHQLADWGQSFRVVSVTGAGPFTITLDHDINWAGATTLAALFRGPDGMASQEASAKRVSNNSFTIATDPGQTSRGLPSVFNWTTTNDPILAVLGATKKFTRDCIVQEINVSGMVCEITAITYDASVYAGAMDYQSTAL